MIHFNVPPFIGTELKYIEEAVKNHKICGDGSFTKKCHEILEKEINSNYGRNLDSAKSKVLLTTSGTSALEMAAVLTGVKAGDEVIMPSYTFCSTADAFVQRGATIVFVDVRKDTMNIDETKIEDAITEKTKVIVPVHYAGVPCEMDTIMEIARKHNLKVVEDNAQGLFSSYKGRALGTIGDIGCLSFHETKNLSMGEGGGVILNHAEDFEKAEILREKGTNRSKFFRGHIDKYSWVDYGSSYLPSDMNAAYLFAQLEDWKKIQDDRMRIWNKYNAELKETAEKKGWRLAAIPSETVHNAHMFYIITNSLEERTSLIDYMKKNDVLCVFHYVPLHSAPAGIKFGRFNGKDEVTTEYSDRLVRLPLYYGLTEEDQNKVIDLIKSF